MQPPTTVSPSRRLTASPSDRRTVPPSHRLTVAPSLFRSVALSLGGLLSFWAALGGAQAQQALTYSLTGETAAVQRGRQKENQPYSFETGDLKVLLRPSLGISYNSDINLNQTNAIADGIFSPMLQVNANYQLTELNTLSFSSGVGYQFYFDNHNYSTWVLTPGSQLSFDIYVQDLWINIHDDFFYQNDPAMSPAVTGSGRYGGFYNTAGLDATWDLRDLVLSLGYDHYNFISSTTAYDYLNRGTELPVGRAGFKFSPAVTAGLEATGSFNRYDKPVLNNSTGFSVGPYADWQVSEYLHVYPRVGYVAYYFDQTSRLVTAQNEDTWYLGLGVAHRLNETVTYTLNAGHELRLGTYSDLVNAWYVRPSINVRLIKDVDLTFGLPYEYGQEVGGGASNHYNWFSGSVSASYRLMKKVTTTLGYRFTIRNSSQGGFDYTQNVVEFTVSYQF